MMLDNDRYIKHLNVLINIEIQLCYCGINLHIIVILVTFWIKLRLIIMIKEENKLIELQNCYWNKLQSSIKIY